MNLKLLVILTCTASPAWGQDVKWFENYDAARAEARKLNRPLLLEFTTDSCIWCRKLEAATLKEPSVVKVLRDGFVAVRIDAEKYQRLAQALKVDGYPTLILASPEGRILSRKDGFVDAGKMKVLLTAALEKCGPVSAVKPVTNIKAFQSIAIPEPEILQVRLPR